MLMSITFMLCITEIPQILFYYSTQAVYARLKKADI